MSEDVLLATMNGNRLSLVLNRPGALNALNPELLEALAEHVRRASGDESVHAITIEGAGERAFSAGFDLKALPTTADSGGISNSYMELATAALLESPKLTVAVVRGHCLGAALDLAFCCDFRVASTDARFAMPATRIGTVYRPRSIERFLRMLGVTATKELFVAGRDFDASRALAAGLVQEVVPAPELAAAVARWVELPPRGVVAALAHKYVVDRLAGAQSRDANFWAELDALRLRSVESLERRAAVAEFVARSERPSRQ